MTKEHFNKPSGVYWSILQDTWANTRNYVDRKFERVLEIRSLATARGSADILYSIDILICRLVAILTILKEVQYDPQDPVTTSISPEDQTETADLSVQYRDRYLDTIQMLPQDYLGGTPGRILRKMFSTACQTELASIESDTTAFIQAQCTRISRLAPSADSPDLDVEKLTDIQELHRKLIATLTVMQKDRDGSYTADHDYARQGD